MSPDRERTLGEKDLAFFGAVAASISHDLNNAIAIIEQTAGLLEDILYDCANGRPIDKDQIQQIAERIAKQTKRGATIIKRLNAFAHSIDDPNSEIDLNELIETVSVLAHRVADRRRVQLEPRPSPGPVKIQGSSFHVQQAIYLSIRDIVAVVPESDTVVVSTGRGDDRAWIAVEGSSSESTPTADPSHLDSLMGALGGEVATATSRGKTELRLLFPAD